MHRHAARVLNYDLNYRAVRRRACQVHLRGAREREVAALTGYNPAASLRRPAGPTRVNPAPLFVCAMR